MNKEAKAKRVSIQHDIQALIARLDENEPEEIGLLSILKAVDTFYGVRQEIVLVGHLAPLLRQVRDAAHELIKREAQVND